ncbi:hypothetical protein HY639_04365 [Candidatus Woesearchaeota archaeon]|nr:hypothetical protein [Candidatus Woesearchaeota archaeon]
MNRKAQAAMEFLMTYGWAILVVLVIIGALGYFGVLSPTALLPEKCIMGVEMACKDYRLEGDKVTLRLQNNLGEAMHISKIVVKSDDKINVLCKNEAIGQPLGNGQTQTYDISGCTGLPERKDQKIKAYLEVTYKKGGATGLEHTIEGEVFATVH